MEGELEELISACTNFYNAQLLREQAEAASNDAPTGAAPRG